MPSSTIIRSGPAPTGNEPSVAERYARLRKALKIADLMQASGIGSALAQMADEDEQKLAAKAAGVDAPSKTTWALVVQLLYDREVAMSIACVRKAAK